MSRNLLLDCRAGLFNREPEQASENIMTSVLSYVICFALGWLTCVAYEQLYEQLEHVAPSMADDMDKGSRRGCNGDGGALA